MSAPNDAPGDLAENNGKSSGVKSNHTAGMSWVGSMFPSIPRDPKIYGPPEPLELVPPPGPFDDENGDEVWRKSHHSTLVYTGEEIVNTIRPPTVEQKQRRKQFWETYEAQQDQPVAVSAQGQPIADEQQHFPDVLPTRSGPVLAPVRVSTPTPAQALAPSAHHSSSIDGEYDSDDDYLADVPHDPSTSTNTNPREQVPDGTPPKMTSPMGVDDWDDSNLLSLWKCKVIRKKGYEPMLATFQHQTVETLHEVWMKHKRRCQQLGAAWEAAKRPRGPLSDWFVE